MKRRLVSSTSPYAPVLGFSRAVRVGTFIAVGGTAALDAEGNTVAPGWKSAASSTRNGWWRSRSMRS